MHKTIEELTSLHNGTPLQEWYNNQNVPDDMIWKDAMKQQFMFVRDKLNGLVNARIQYEDITPVQVISTHRSKSIMLPVYHLQRDSLNIILRENFYNWKMTVISDKPIINGFTSMFHTTTPLEPDYTGNPLSSVYFEGFPEELCLDYYEETDKCCWSAEIRGDYFMYMTIFMIMKSLGYIKPLEWNTKEKYQKEMQERKAKREKDKDNE